MNQFSQRKQIQIFQKIWNFLLQKCSVNLNPLSKGRKISNSTNLYLYFFVYVYQHMVSRDVLRTQSNVCDGAFCKKSFIVDVLCGSKYAYAFIFIIALHPPSPVLFYIQKQPPEVFYNKGVPKNFAKFTEKHLFQSLFLIEQQVARLLL